MVLDQGAQRGRSLVVGRVGLEDEMGEARDGARQLARRRGSRVVEHDVVAELDARLHDQGDDAFPGALQTGAGEGALGQLARAVRVGRGGDGGPRLGGLFAARYRHFGADDVEGGGLACGQPAPRLLGDRGQLGRAGGRGLVAQGIAGAARVVGQAHAAVQVDLGVAGQHIGAHQLAGLGHGLRGRLVPPRVGTEVVSAEDHAGNGVLLPGRRLGDQRPEAGRAQAGVAAELVDLVAGRLDEHDRLVAPALRHGGLEHEPVGRTDRRQPDGVAAPVGFDQVEQTGRSSR